MSPKFIWSYNALLLCLPGTLLRYRFTYRILGKKPCTEPRPLLVCQLTPQARDGAPFTLALTPAHCLNTWTNVIAAVFCTAFLSGTPCKAESDMYCSSDLEADTNGDGDAEAKLREWQPTCSNQTPTETVMQRQNLGNDNRLAATSTNCLALWRRQGLSVQDRFCSRELPSQTF